MYSVCYGALGNLNVDRDSIDVALHYYDLAGELFEKHGWKEQLSILYGNESELYRRLNNKHKGLEMAKKSREYALETGDSLMLAMSAANLAESYSGLHRYGKALQCSREAYDYFKVHDREEAMALAESLETISDIYRRQRSVYMLIAIGALFLAVMALLVSLRVHKRRLTEVEAPAEHHIEVPDIGCVKLNDREQDILHLLADGKTSKEIAAALCLSVDTVNWYRKRLISKFGVSNTAELVARIAARDARSGRA